MSLFQRKRKPELCILYVYAYKLLAMYHYFTCMCIVKVAVCLKTHQNAPQNMHLKLSKFSGEACPYGKGALGSPKPSGSFRVARLPGHSTCAARAVSSWVEKNPVLPPNRRALDWSAVLTVGGLCPIILQENIVVSNKHN